MATSQPNPLSLLAIVNGVLPSLTAAEARVAEVVIRDPGAVADLTITALADEADTSEATVIRFCRSLGLDGHRQLRLRAAQTVANEPQAPDAGIAGGDIPVGADMRRIIDTVAYADEHAVRDTVRALDAHECERVVSAVVDASRVDVFGVGASGVVAADLTQKLHRIGHTVFGWQDVHSALTGAALLTGAGLAVGISHSGATVDTIDFLRRARRQGATTVALTNHPRSPIVSTADHVLVTAARETTFRSGATASRIAQLTVIDCLFVGVAARRRGEAADALTVTADAVADRRK
ncbi:MAG: MurR/RpiR family transcriptional regulator [Stackebrandtia sp.]